MRRQSTHILCSVRFQYGIRRCNTNAPSSCARWNPKSVHRARTFQFCCSIFLSKMENSNFLSAHRALGELHDLGERVVLEPDSNDPHPFARLAAWSDDAIPC